MLSGLHLRDSFVWQEFALCAQWSELYAVPDHLRLQLKTEHLLHLLEKTKTDEAFQVLHTGAEVHSGQMGSTLTNAFVAVA